MGNEVIDGYEIDVPSEPVSVNEALIDWDRERRVIAIRRRALIDGLEASFEPSGDGLDNSNTSADRTALLILATFVDLVTSQALPPRAVCRAFEVIPEFKWAMEA